MRLSLSSSAAPDARLVELVAACARRGLAGLELVDGDAHRVTAGLSQTGGGVIRAAARNAGVEICAYYRTALEPADLGAALSIAGALGVPLVVPVDNIDRATLADLAGTAAATGTELLVGWRRRLSKLLSAFLAFLSRST